MSINMKASISASYLDKGAWFKPVEESEEHKNAKATQEKFSGAGQDEEGPGNGIG